MKNRALLITICIFLIMVSACQPTPSEDVIVGKDSEYVIELSKAEDAINDNILDSIPDNLEMEIEDSNGKTRIKVNAKVCAPDVKKFPIVRVKAGRFDEKDIQRLHYAICPDVIPIDENGPLFRAYYQRIIDELIERRETGELGKYQNIDELDKAIADTIADMQIAPIEPISVAVDYTFVDGTIARILGVHNENIISDMTIKNANRENLNAEVQYLRDAHNCRSEFSLHTAQGDTISSLYSVTKDCNLVVPKISEQEAIQIANKIIEMLNLDSYSFAGSRLAPLFRVIDEETRNACKTAYELLYVRSIGGIDVTYTNHYQSYGNDESTQVSMPWKYEKIRVYVDDNGVYAFLWYAPYEVVETMNEDATMLTFDQIKDIFKQAALIKYCKFDNAETNTMNEINITEVKLGLARIIEKDNPGQALLVPAWDFFGTYETNGYTIGLDGYESLLTINAIDGSVIDRNTGY